MIDATRSHDKNWAVLVPTGCSLYVTGDVDDSDLFPPAYNDARKLPLRLS